MANLITLKLVVDKKKNRVLFADCDKDFVDILFSFLTLPMGTIIRLLDKKSEIGCLDKLYESVENLDTKYFATEACKMMLLETRSEADKQCEFLKINIGDQDPRTVYRCPKWDCYTKTHRLLSDVRGARCGCGQAMNSSLEWPKSKFDTNADSVFVKGSERFFITDDFQVMSVSSGSSTISLLQRFKIEDFDSIETRTVDVSKEKVLKLLKRMLLSKAPLSEVFLLMVPDPVIHESKPEQYNPILASRVKEEGEASNDSKVLSLRLVESKSMKMVLYVEGGNDLANILTSFLTFPLGSIVKLLNKHSSMGRVDNLYRSVEVLSGVGDNDRIKSTECKEMLLSPKLVVHFGCSDQLLMINENPPTASEAYGCETCCGQGNPCSHGIAHVKTALINPKLPNADTKQGGGFAKGSIKFMVADDSTVSPCSVDASIDAIKRLKAPISSLVERDITWGEAEVLNLLKVCITSPSVLNSFKKAAEGAIGFQC